MRSSGCVILLLLFVFSGLLAGCGGGLTPSLTSRPPAPAPPPPPPPPGPGELAGNPGSVSFGNVVVNGTGMRTVTLSDTGGSKVTIQQVRVAGAGFGASGVSAGTVIQPGGSAALSVTLMPGAAGAASGSVTVTSDAANTPLTVALSGTGVTATTNAPTCGASGDNTVHVPADWAAFVPPPLGQSYVDPTFGCTVTRITDVSSEDPSGSTLLLISHGYSTVSPFNANDTFLMLVDGSGRHFVKDLNGNTVVPIANMPPANDTWFLWDAANPGIFYYTRGNSMMQGTISGSSVATSVVHQFTEYPAVNFMDATDVSQDGAHVAMVGGDTTGLSPENVFVYDFVANNKGPVYTTLCTGSVDGPNNGCLHKLIQTADNNVVIQFATDGILPEQGNRLWTGLPLLLPLQDATNHLDTGYDLNGNPIFVEVGNLQVLSTLPGITNPCPGGFGLDVRLLLDLLSAACLLDGQPAWHVGYRGNAQQPWVGLSFFDNRTPSPEWFDPSPNFAAPSAANWQLYEDEIVLARIDAGNNPSQIYRLARAYSRSDEDFFAQPRAAISRDGRYIAFDSNMAYAHTGCPAGFETPTNCTDVYVIKAQ